MLRLWFLFLSLLCSKKLHLFFPVISFISHNKAFFWWNQLPLPCFVLVAATLLFCCFLFMCSCWSRSHNKGARQMMNNLIAQLFVFCPLFSKNHGSSAPNRLVMGWNGITGAISSNCSNNIWKSRPISFYDSAASSIRTKWKRLSHSKKSQFSIILLTFDIEGLLVSIFKDTKIFKILIIL